MNPGGGSGSLVEVVPENGRVQDGRPVVLDSFPTGGGQTVSTPVVVVFNESISGASLAAGEPMMGPGGIPIPAAGGVFVRDTTTMMPVAGTIDLLQGGRAVLFLPATLAPMTEYEIVIAAGVTDVDGVPLGTEDFVAGFFTTDAADDSEPRVIATLPTDNQDNVPVGVDAFVFFDRSADAGTVVAQNLVLEVGGVDVPAAVSTPIMGVTGLDTRIARIAPTAPVLEPDTRYEIELSTDIQFGGMPLDTGGASPFSVFETAPLSTALDFRAVGAPAEFPLAITGPLLQDLGIEVDLDASVPAGARVVVRIYGGDPETTADDDLTFIERTATVEAAGPASVTVPFGTALGMAGATNLEEGEVTVQVDVRQGSVESGFLGAAGNGSLDTASPEVMSFAPMLGTDTTTIVTDQASLLAFGVASEPLGSAEFVVDGVTVGLFASDADGRFVLEPIALDRSRSTFDYTLNLTDTAGNVSAMALTGQIVRRGVVRQTGMSAELAVEVYDEATLEVVPDASVVVVPSGGGPMMATTDASGVAAFSALPAGTVSISVVADEFDLVSLLDTEARFVSLPVRPTGVARTSSTLDASVVFLPDGSTTARFGTNLPLDPFDGVASTEIGNPNMPPDIVTRTARPFANSALTGNFAMPVSPFFGNFACELCGLDGLTASVGSPPAAVGETVSVVLAPITPPDTPSVTITNPPVVDFGPSGLGALSGGPVVDVLAAYAGLPGAMLVGAGSATAGSGAQFNVNGAYFSSAFGVLATLAPTLLLSTTAEDDTGVRTRVRQVLQSPAGGVLFPGIDPIGPAVLSPSAMAGESSVTVADVLDPTTVIGGLGLLEVVATDGGGRSWRIFRQDTDAATGSDVIELPDLGMLTLTGLQAGDWSVTADAILFVDLAGSGSNFLFEDRLRLEVARSRSLPLVVTVN